jgi:hypothetical protein
VRSEYFAYRIPMCRKCTPSLQRTDDIDPKGGYKFGRPKPPQREAPRDRRGTVGISSLTVRRNFPAKAATCPEWVATHASSNTKQR